MTPRIRDAARTATQVAVGPALVGIFTGLGASDSEGFSAPVRVLIGVAGGLALFFALAFPLALAFPPTMDASGHPRFPGARKVIWPTIGLAIAGVIYVVITR